MTNKGLAAVILAAGEGTRMKSVTAKVLHEVAGLPMVSYPVRLAGAVGVDTMVLVVGRDSQSVLEAAGRHVPAGVRMEAALQKERLGTAHAVQVGMEKLAGFDGRVLILYGDVPCLEASTVRKMISRADKKGEALVLLTAVLDEPFGYGRIVRDGNAGIAGIVEEKDASPEQRSIREVNAGTYLVDATLLAEGLKGIGRENKKGEFYLTDLVELAVSMGRGVGAVQAGDPGEVQGVNDRLQLAEAEKRVMERVKKTLMRKGVTIRLPDTVLVDATVKVGPDTVLDSGSALKGDTRLGRACHVGPNAVVVDSVLGNGVKVGPGAVVTGARLGRGVQVPAGARVGGG